MVCGVWPRGLHSWGVRSFARLPGVQMGGAHTMAVLIDTAEDALLRKHYVEFMVVSLMLVAVAAGLWWWRKRDIRGEKEE